MKRRAEISGIENRKTIEEINVIIYSLYISLVKFKSFPQFLSGFLLNSNSALYTLDIE